MRVRSAKCAAKTSSSIKSSSHVRCQAPQVLINDTINFKLMLHTLPMCCVRVWRRREHNRACLYECNMCYNTITHQTYTHAYSFTHTVRVCTYVALACVHDVYMCNLGVCIEWVCVAYRLCDYYCGVVCVRVCVCNIWKSQQLMLTLTHNSMYIITTFLPFCCT